MLKAGSRFEIPGVGIAVHVLKGDAETDSMGWSLEVTCRQGSPKPTYSHLHQNWTETFVITSGEACYELDDDGKTRTLGAGQSFVVKPMQFHKHPWNVAGEPLVFLQNNVFGVRSPRALEEMVGEVATVAGRLRDKSTEPSGMGSKLAFAEMRRLMGKHGTYYPGSSIARQKLKNMTVGLLGALLGYRAYDPKYTQDKALPGF